MTFYWEPADADRPARHPVIPCRHCPEKIIALPAVPMPGNPAAHLWEDAHGLTVCMKARLDTAGHLTWPSGEAAPEKATLCHCAIAAPHVLGAQPTSYLFHQPMPVIP